MTTRETFVRLYKKYLDGRATPEEMEQLDAYRDEFDLDGFDNDLRVPRQEQIRVRIYQQIEKRISEPEKRGRGINWPRLGAVAAAIMALAGFSLLYREMNMFNGIQKPLQLSKAIPAIAPGSNKAILILEDGDKIDLDHADRGEIGRVSKTMVSKIGDGQLQYAKAVPATGRNGAPAYNTIITPRGGQYQVVLSDGTVVWLNSATSLRYPTVFTGSERRVELTGEAYFEVAKNKSMPFKVDAGKVNVEVLGTHFNVTAYSDEQASKTTLLEGSVRLSKADQSVTLTPGQQAVAEDNASTITTKNVNVQDAIAWKNGYFSFRKEDIRSALRKISRWYDVDVVYEGKISNKLLGGSITRTQDIGETLSYLETIGIAKFTIQGRRIMVKAN